MKRRPTIAFAKWRLAVHLAETQKVQGHAAMPAFQCQCELCQSWQVAHLHVIPTETLNELRRLGVQVATPNELYALSSGQREARAIYHVVGKVLSGPTATVFDKVLATETANYELLRTEPWFAVRVTKASESVAPSPSIDDKNAGDVIVIDCRFTMQQY